MKKSTKHKILIILKSLPALPVAIVLVLYGMSFLPLTAEKMERSSVLVERTWYYAILADGKAVAFVSDTADVSIPYGILAKADSTVKNRAYTGGCFINRYPFFPSCHGKILSVAPQDKSFGMMPISGKEAEKLLHGLAEKATEAAENMRRKTEELDYYLKVHSVSDAGYNTMADYSTGIDRQKALADKTISMLNAAKGRKIEIRPVTTYAVIYKDKEGRTQRKECSLVSNGNAEGMYILQVKDGKTPEGAVPLDFHPWLTAKLETGDSIAVPCFPGCTMPGFETKKTYPKIFDGCIMSHDSHDLPIQLAPSGVPVYSRHGFLKGVNGNGRVINPGLFGFGFKNILP